ncbi:cobalamin B12-binding domain-containing protein [Chloroflexota bacterium]
MYNKRIRVLVGKPGLDGHDRGVKVVARGLRDAGMEVIYLGIRLTPEQIAEAAMEEDVDVVGLSCLSGAHMALFPKTATLIRENGGSDILMVGGGIIPDKDIPKLEESGIDHIFGPGTSLEEIVKTIIKKMRKKIGDKKD